MTAILIFSHKGILPKYLPKILHLPFVPIIYNMILLLRGKLPRSVGAQYATGE